MAISVNKVVLVGRLGGEPEVRGQHGDIVNLNVATSESWRDKQTGERTERTQWHKVVIFAEQVGKFICQYAHKGDLVYVEGQLETRKWERAPDDVVYFTEVVVRPFGGSVQLQSKDKREAEEPEERRGADRDLADQTARQAREEAALAKGKGKPKQEAKRSFARDLDDEIPF